MTTVMLQLTLHRCVLPSNKDDKKPLLSASILVQTNTC